MSRDPEGRGGGNVPLWTRYRDPVFRESLSETLLAPTPFGPRSWSRKSLSLPHPTCCLPPFRTPRRPTVSLPGSRQDPGTPGSGERTGVFSVAGTRLSHRRPARYGGGGVRRHVKCRSRDGLKKTEKEKGRTGKERSTERQKGGRRDRDKKRTRNRVRGQNEGKTLERGRKRRNGQGGKERNERQLNLKGTGSDGAG